MLSCKILSSGSMKTYTAKLKFFPGFYLIVTKMLGIMHKLVMNGYEGKARFFSQSATFHLSLITASL